MLIFAHPGQPIAPHDVWGAWNADPLLLLVGAGWLYWRGAVKAGRSPRDRASTWFALGLVAVGVALVSPLDAMGGSLASAHMVQHLLLVLVAAPLLVLGRPVATVMRGMSRGIRKSGGRWRRIMGLTPARLGWARNPATVWIMHVATLWVWHASVPYQAALRHEPIHILEHATFLVTALLFWSVVLGGPHRRAGLGGGVLMLFTVALQGVLLSVLITFATTPWYPGYAGSTRLWGMDPLEDQQLAGVIMWIPSGLIYTGAGLALLVAWLNATESREAGGFDATVTRLPPEELSKRSDWKSK